MGYLNAVDGKSVDYEFVAHRLVQVIEKYDVRKIAFDRWNFKHLRPCLVRAGISEKVIEEKFEEFGQGFQSMSPALRQLETMLLNERMIHGNHPIMNMCADAAVVRTDPAGNRKLDKSKSTNRIDGMVALAMAAGVAAGANETEKPREFQMLFM
jgi:phage terminase large subunit-like protein